MLSLIFRRSKWHKFKYMVRNQHSPCGEEPLNSVDLLGVDCIEIPPLAVQPLRDVVEPELLDVLLVVVLAGGPAARAVAFKHGLR